MSSGKRDVPPDSPNFDAAFRVTELLSGADPAKQRELAHKHFARARRPKSVKSMTAVRPVTASRTKTYIRSGPTRSRVLNAFLYEVGAAHSMPADVIVLDEQMLAQRLVELARKYLAPMTAAAGHVEAALRIAAELPAVTSPRLARLVLRRALTDPTALGAIARDYEEHRRKTAAAEQDDLEGQAILAAFAGRVVAHAERLLGPHVHEEVQSTLRRLAPPRAAPGRKPSVRMPAVQERSGRVDKKRGFG